MDPERDMESCVAFRLIAALIVAVAVIVVLGPEWTGVMPATSHMVQSSGNGPGEPRGHSI